jgi:hypothetical protein
MTYSTKQFFERMGAGNGGTTLRTNQPMDAGYTWTLIDNVAHLVDESPKYRINFMHNTTSLKGMKGPIKEFYFLTQVTENNKYPRYDVRVAMGLGSSETETHVALVIPSVFGSVRSADDTGVLGYWHGDSPGPDLVEWVVDDVTGDVDTNRCPIATIPAANVISGDVTVGYVAMLKLIVEWDYATSESGPNALLCGVQVREFLVTS